MKKAVIIFLCAAAALSSFCFKYPGTGYGKLYASAINNFDRQQYVLLDRINTTVTLSAKDRQNLKAEIETARLQLKNIDFWLRYLEPIAYKKINGPLPVEWENEVFEKFEKPYRREGAGLTLAEIYLDEKNISKDSLAHLIKSSIEAIDVFRADSITSQLGRPDHFFLCNRLYLLNLAAIYTTGVECPGRQNIIPELKSMMVGVKSIYAAYDESFTDKQLPQEYTSLYAEALIFVNSQPVNASQFDHFTFIKEYVNPLFNINQRLIKQYHVLSTSFNDYTLNNDCRSIFDKSLYKAQSPKGVFSLVEEKGTLEEIKQVGKLLFYDPILSGNNSRSCASCHKPDEYFTDTAFATALQFDGKQRLRRNAPTLINAIYNHLLMLDGKHATLQEQAVDVITRAEEMSGGGKQEEILARILSCKAYKITFKKLLKATPEMHEITMEHVVSAVTYYFSSFSNYYSSFDDAMNKSMPLDKPAVNGFNIFMGKGRCATCHYVPQFNGVAPPYISSEFEVLGTPDDTTFKKQSNDKGRYVLNPATEMMGAFRTGTVRNAAYTRPYMHNGVFSTLAEVIDFYDAGGGAGRKLSIANQTLPGDSLRLTTVEKKELIQFIYSLNENITFDRPPAQLPVSSRKELNTRKPGGTY